MGDVPDIDIEFVDSAEAPVGLGEPATTVVGSGHRQRDLRRLRRAGCATCRSARMQFCGLSTQRADRVGDSTPGSRMT